MKKHKQNKNTKSYSRDSRGPNQGQGRTQGEFKPKPKPVSKEPKPVRRPDERSVEPKPKHSGPKVRPDLYGMHAVTEALGNSDRDCRTLYVVDGVPVPDCAVPLVIVTKPDMDKMCPQGAVHQGIALDCSALPEVGIEDILIRTHAKKDSVIVILDQVTDPHNVGAIIRSCAAFGADGVVMQRKHAPELVGVLAKTACGGIEHVPVAYETNLSRTIEQLQEAGYFVYGLDERGENVIGDLKPGGKAVIVLGAEGSGLRRLVAEHCDALVRLPTKPPIGSLNVSNAAAVALYAMLA
jgi:23S rRNA (guanosine2251-2'-O)-methyltransferase